MPCSFIPPYVLRRLAHNTVLGPASTVGEHTLELDRVLRSGREDPPPTLTPPAAGLERAAAAAASRLVHTANNSETLPGDLARTDGDPATGDPAVDEAFDFSGKVLDLFSAAFGRRRPGRRGTPGWPSSAWPERRPPIDEGALPGEPRLVHSRNPPRGRDH